MNDEYKSIKHDLLEREDVKKRIGFSNAAILASLTGAGFASYYKKKAPLYAALGVAAGAGYNRGKNEQHKKELGRKIKGRFGVQEEKVFNPGALVPKQEKFAEICKEAITGSLVHMLSDLIPYYHHLPHMIQQALPLSLDLATIPALGIAAKHQLQNVSQLAAKNSLKMPMSSGETMRFGFAKKLKDLHDAAHEVKNPILGPAARYFGGYLAAPAAGIDIGEGMAKGLKWLPKGMRETVVDAVKSEGAQKAVVDAVNEMKRIAGDVGTVGMGAGGGYLASKLTDSKHKKKDPTI